MRFLSTSKQQPVTTQMILKCVYAANSLQIMLCNILMGTCTTIKQARTRLHEQLSMCKQYILEASIVLIELYGIALKLRTNAYTIYIPRVYSSDISYKCSLKCESQPFTLAYNIYKRIYIIEAM